MEFGELHILPMACLPAGEFARRETCVVYALQVRRIIDARPPVGKTGVQKVDYSDKVGVCSKIDIHFP